MEKKKKQFIEKIDSSDCYDNSFCTAFRCIMEAVKILINYDHINLWLVNEEQLVGDIIIPASLSLIASKGDFFAEQLDSTYLDIDDSWSGQAILEKRIMRTGDLRNNNKFKNTKMLDVIGANYVVTIPLIAPRWTNNKKINGVINIYFKDCVHISDDLCNFISYHVSNTLEKLKLIHRDVVTSQLLHYSSGTLKVHFNKCIKQMLNYGAEAVSIFTFHRRRNKLILAESTGFIDKNINYEEVKYEIGYGITGKVAYTKKPIIIHNLLDNSIKPMHQGAFVEFTKTPLRSFIATPIINKNGELVGVIRCVNKVLNERYSASFSVLDLEILNRIADILCQHIERNKLEQTRESLLAKIPHDLKSPIIGVRNLAAQIGKYHNSDQLDIKRKSEDIIDDCNLMLCLISQIQIKRDYMFVRSNIRVDVFIKLTKQLRPFIREFNLSSLDYTSLSGLSSHMFVDINQLQLLFFNLLMNAIKYSYPETDIVVFSREIENSYVAITVQNWGIGIGEDESLAIFRPEYRSPQAERRINGTGWGLAIAQEIAEKHGGKIIIEKLKDPTEFTLLLPTYLRYRSPK